jgi:signal transduction histidine kinase
LTRLYSYVLFHSIAEVFSIVVTFGIFMVFWNARRFMQNDYFLFLGIAYLFVAGIDLLHTLAYKGMGVFLGYDTNLPTQLWIAARYLQSLSLLAASLFLFRKPRIRPAFLFLGYAAITSLVLASIFYWGVFPDCFIEGQGLTPFKKVSEYIICLFLLASLALLYQKRRQFDPGVFQLLSASIGVMIAAEMAFTLYVDVYGLLNLLGHLLKIVAFYLVYKAFVEVGLTQPYSLLFRDLKQNEDALARQAQELARSNADLEHFAYVASHDLQEPLRMVTSYLQLLERRYQGQLDDKARDFIGYAVDGATRMQKMIQALLDYSRLSSHGRQFAPVDSQRVLEGVLSDLGPALEESDTSLTFDPLPIVIGDETQLGMLFQNLIDNAIKFRNREAPRVHISAVRGEDEWTFSVCDNGIGIDPAHAGRIFLMFQRLHTRQEYPGTGIGLAACQRIVERHGGRIWVESQPGEGSTFYFTLPASDEAPYATFAPPQSRDRQSSSLPAKPDPVRRSDPMPRT